VRGVVIVVPSCVIDGFLQMVRVYRVELSRQVTVGVRPTQIVDVNVGRVADSNSTTVAECSMTSVVGVHIVMFRAMDSA